VASIVRNHAGEINLTSTQGKGTTVTVRWPAFAGVNVNVNVNKASEVESV
jgi:signal transduction histidine kinase